MERIKRIGDLLNELEMEIQSYDEEDFQDAMDAIDNLSEIIERHRDERLKEKIRSEVYDAMGDIARNKSFEDEDPVDIKEAMEDAFEWFMTHFFEC